MPESRPPRGREEVALRGFGSITFVRLGRGEEGREGGSWVWAAGVEAVSSVIICG